MTSPGPGTLGSQELWFGDIVERAAQLAKTQESRRPNDQTG